MERVVREPETIVSNSQRPRCVVKDGVVVNDTINARDDDSIPSCDQSTGMAAQSFEVASPCIGVCVLNQATQHCLGCWRTMEEISRWLRMSEVERQQVIEECRCRRQADMIDGE